MDQALKYLNSKQLPRVLVSAAILGIYGLYPDEHNRMFAEIVVAYWLGSSAGSFNKDERNATRSN